MTGMPGMPMPEIPATFNPGDMSSQVPDAMQGMWTHAFGIGGSSAGQAGTGDTGNTQSASSWHSAFQEWNQEGYKFGSNIKLLSNGFETPQGTVESGKEISLAVGQEINLVNSSDVAANLSLTWTLPPEDATTETLTLAQGAIKSLSLNTAGTCHIAATFTTGRTLALALNIRSSDQKGDNWKDNFGQGIGVEYTNGAKDAFGSQVTLGIKVDGADGLATPKLGPGDPLRILASIAGGSAMQPVNLYLTIDTPEGGQFSITNVNELDVGLRMLIADFVMAGEEVADVEIFNVPLPAGLADGEYTISFGAEDSDSRVVAATTKFTFSATANTGTPTETTEDTDSDSILGTLSLTASTDDQTLVTPQGVKVVVAGGGVSASGTQLQVATLGQPPVETQGSAAFRTAKAYQFRFSGTTGVTVPQMTVEIPFDRSAVPTAMEGESIDNRVTGAYWDAANACWTHLPTEVQRGSLVDTLRVTVPPVAWGAGINNKPRAMGARAVFDDNGQFLTIVQRNIVPAFRVNNNYRPIIVTYPTKTSNNGWVWTDDSGQRAAIRTPEDFADACARILQNAYSSYNSWGRQHDLDGNILRQLRMPENVYLCIEDADGAGEAEWNWMSKNINITFAADPFSDYAKLRHDLAHELFHQIQNQYWNFVSMNSGRWFTEAMADFAAACIFTGDTTRLSLTNRQQYLCKPVDFYTGTANDSFYFHAYQTAFFLRDLPMDFPFFAWIMDNATPGDVLASFNEYEPLAGYFQNVSGATPLEKAYSVFALNFLFSSTTGAMPADDGPSSGFYTPAERVPEKALVSTATMGDGDSIVQNSLTIEPRCSAKVWKVAATVAADRGPRGLWLVADRAPPAGVSLMAVNLRHDLRGDYASVVALGRGIVSWYADNYTDWTSLHVAANDWLGISPDCIVGIDLADSDGLYIVAINSNLSGGACTIPVSVVDPLNVNTNRIFTLNSAEAVTSVSSASERTWLPSNVLKGSYQSTVNVLGTAETGQSSSTSGSQSTVNVAVPTTPGTLVGIAGTLKAELTPKSGRIDSIPDQLYYTWSVNAARLVVEKRTWAIQESGSSATLSPEWTVEKKTDNGTEFTASYSPGSFDTASIKWDLDQGKRVGMEFDVMVEMYTKRTWTDNGGEHSEWQKATHAETWRVGDVSIIASRNEVMHISR